MAKSSLIGYVNNRRKRSGVIKRATRLILVLASTAFASNSKISPDLQPLLANPSNMVNVIVQYDSAPICSGGILTIGQPCTTVNLMGGLVNEVFTLINAVMLKSLPVSHPG